MILYTTETCPKCKILKAKMDILKLNYEIINDIETIEKEGIMSVPVLDIDGEKYNFESAVKKINALGE